MTKVKYSATIIPDNDTNPLIIVAQDDHVDNWIVINSGNNKIGIDVKDIKALISVLTNYIK